MALATQHHVYTKPVPVKMSPRLRTSVVIAAETTPDSPANWQYFAEDAETFPCPKRTSQAQSARNCRVGSEPSWPPKDSRCAKSHKNPKYSTGNLRRFSCRTICTMTSDSTHLLRACINCSLSAGFPTIDWPTGCTFLGSRWTI